MSKDQGNSEFEKSYSEDSLWEKIKVHAKSIGSGLIYKALLLFYAARADGTPTWAKTTIYGALGYLISPIDAIPDLTPVLGYSDDLGVLVAALAAVALYVNKAVHEKAQKRYESLLGKPYSGE